jgi:hypothetical protein
MLWVCCGCGLPGKAKEGERRLREYVPKRTADSMSVMIPGCFKDWDLSASRFFLSLSFFLFNFLALLGRRSDRQVSAHTDADARLHPQPESQGTSRADGRAAAALFALILIR